MFQNISNESADDNKPLYNSANGYNKSAIVTFSPAPNSKFAQSFALSEQIDVN
jgi:hypothetical protein